ncbi:MAG: YqeG family HAD IIIA-type phosphatase [Clostridia bacterium]|nr:YqeG family HAD IIIA-type phosphatase [Clostridia bacterium]
MANPVNLLIPDLICKEVYDVPFSRFWEEGVRVVVFDIDNTLVSYETPKPTQKVKELLSHLSGEGFSVALVSNNSPERVELFNAELGYFAVADSHKPLKRALKPVFARFSVSSKQLLLVGDQLLTDVLAARLHGARAVTVLPIKKKENLFFRFKRFLEKPFIRIYYRRKRKEEKK